MDPAREVPDSSSVVDPHSTLLPHVTSSTSKGYSALPRFLGDPATIARGVFQYEVTGALKVMRNCGALRSAAERQWCQEELERLLAQLCPSGTSK
jgi:hypothetical protein